MDNLENQITSDLSVIENTEITTEVGTPEQKPQVILPSENPATDAEFFTVHSTVVYHISDFDGPIDLLLELVKSAKIRIEDIFISEVTKQYVEIIKATPREELDYEYAGEFITFAAELVYLKSLRTLPKEDEDEDDGVIDEREAFINKIKEYALLKEQAEKMRDMETINRFVREPVYSDKDYRVCLTNFSLPKLVEAFARVLANSERAVRDAIPKKVVKDRFSVHEQMTHIRELIYYHGSFDFEFLFEPDFDRGDIVITFLAVLELMKYGIIKAEQEEAFGKIILYKVEGNEETAIQESADGEYK
ncbi:MAG: segregation/condensation protein A [Clostridia bacterium]|nr:segregation/condensation protein A [Clostridia bacterium]